MVKLSRRLGPVGTLPLLSQHNHFIVWIHSSSFLANHQSVGMLCECVGESWGGHSQSTNTSHSTLFIIHPFKMISILDSFFFFFFPHVSLSNWCWCVSLHQSAIRSCCGCGGAIVAVASHLVLKITWTFFCLKGGVSHPGVRVHRRSV